MSYSPTVSLESMEKCVTCDSSFVIHSASSANVNGFFFAFCVLVDGVKYKTGMGTTKKVARLKAAELALQDLLPRLENEKADFPKVSGQAS